MSGLESHGKIEVLRHLPAGRRQLLRHVAWLLAKVPVANDVAGIIEVSTKTIPIALLEVGVAGHDAPAPLPHAKA